MAYTPVEIGNSQIEIKTTRLVTVKKQQAAEGGREPGFGWPSGGYD